MLRHVLFSCGIFLLLSTFCSGKTYDFSWHKNAKKQSAALEGGRKLLTHGASCTYKWNEVGEEQKKANLCRRSAEIRCEKNICVCSGSGAVWDPKIQYISTDPQDMDQLVTGKCGLVKGEECNEKVGKPNSGNQCKSDLTCALDPKMESSQPDFYPLRLDGKVKEKEIYGICK